VNLEALCVQGKARSCLHNAKGSKGSWKGGSKDGKSKSYDSSKGKGKSKSNPSHSKGKG
jgi:hypothetical protein